MITLSDDLPQVQKQRKRLPHISFWRKRTVEKIPCSRHSYMPSICHSFNLLNASKRTPDIDVTNYNYRSNIPLRVTCSASSQTGIRTETLWFSPAFFRLKHPVSRCIHFTARTQKDRAFDVRLFLLTEKRLIPEQLEFCHRAQALARRLIRILGSSPRIPKGFLLLLFLQKGRK